MVSLLGGGAAWMSTIALAEAAGQSPTIGFLGSGSQTNSADRLAGFWSGLNELGYYQGKNIIVYFRWADGNYDLLPRLAAELAALNVAAIVTHGTPGTRAAQRATKTIPIVMATSGDALLTGLVDSLAHPGGNLTGLSFFAPDLTAKRLDFLSDILPRLARLAFVFNSNNKLPGELEINAIREGAKAKNIEVFPFGITSAGEFEGTFARIAAEGFEAVFVQGDSIILENARSIAEIAVAKHLSLFGDAAIASAGGLVGYGPNFPKMFGRAAYFIDKILKGATPSDLPVEQPTVFDLVINLKTAKALGVQIPATMLSRADEVIE
jgi:putative tryptophan/tyrosine transport system substrate-binding protein